MLLKTLVVYKLEMVQHVQEKMVTTLEQHFITQQMLLLDNLGLELTELSGTITDQQLLNQIQC